MNTFLNNEKTNAVVNHLSINNAKQRVTQLHWFLSAE